MNCPRCKSCVVSSYWKDISTLSYYLCDECSFRFTFKPIEKVVRKEYLTRLIAQVRKQIAKDPDTIAAAKEVGEVVIIGRWLDATLLCNIIEDEILNNDEIPGV